MRATLALNFCMTSVTNIFSDTESIRFEMKLRLIPNEIKSLENLGTEITFMQNEQNSMLLQN